MTKPLTGKVAIVAGASRGCGRGIAVALGEAGATVYVTGRTTRGGSTPGDKAPGTIEDTAEEVTRRGGLGVPVRVDHSNPVQVDDLFSRVRDDYERLDILACAVWGGNERYLDPVWDQPFWKQPGGVWNEFLDGGPHSFWLVACAAARLMSECNGKGLIVAVTEPILSQLEEHPPSLAGTFRHLAHYSINRLVDLMASQTRDAGISVVGLLPGFMRTERVQMHLPDEASRETSRYDLSESPEYSGRAVAALAADPNVLAKSGRLLYVSDLAEEYDFTDIDGKQVANFYRVLGLQ